MSILVSKIVVPESLLDSGAGYELFEAAIEFSRGLTERGCYEPSEILPDLIHLEYLWRYAGAVQSGGHESFVSNVGWDAAVLDGIDQILAKIPAPNHRSTFRSFRAYVEADTDRLAEMQRSRGFDWDGDSGEVGVRQFDDEFFNADADKPIYNLASQFVRSHPLLEVVDDVDYVSKINEVDAMNEHRGQRLADREYAKEMQRRSIERGKEARKVLLQQIGEAAGRFLTTIRVHTDDGERSGILLETSTGRQVVFFEDKGRAFLASYPEPKEIAEVQLPSLDSWTGQFP